MELIWVCWFIFGLVSGVIVVACSSCVVYEIKDKHDGNCNSVPDSNGNIRERDGMDRRIPTKEEIERVLYYFRTGASFREKVVIDFLIDKETKDEEEIY